MSDEPDLERLYDEHSRAVYAFLLTLTRDPEIASDLLQDIWVKLAHQPGLMLQARVPRSFLFRLAHNVFVDFHRRNRSRHLRHQRLAEDTSDLFESPADPEEAEFRRQLSDALAKLPPEQRSVLHLKIWERLTFDAIGMALDIKPNTAASRYRYAINKLRDLMRPVIEPG